MADMDYLKRAMELEDRGTCEPTVIIAHALIALVQEVRTLREALTGGPPCAAPR